MPRGVASIDPQDSPFSLSSLSRHATPRRPHLGLACCCHRHHPLYYPTTSPSRSSPPLLLPRPLPSVYPAGTPARPSFLVYFPFYHLARTFSRLSHTHWGSHTIADFSLPAMRTPPSSPRRAATIPTAARMLLRRSIEADALSSNHAESDGSDELLRIPGLDPSATLRMEIKAMPLETREREKLLTDGTSASSQKIALNFCGDPISVSRSLKLNTSENIYVRVLSYFLFASSALKWKCCLFLWIISIIFASCEKY